MHHDRKVPSSFSWHYTSGTLHTLNVKTSAGLHFDTCFHCWTLFPPLPWLAVWAPPSRPSHGSARFHHGEQSGSLAPVCEITCQRPTLLRNKIWHFQELWFSRASVFCWEWINIQMKSAFITPIPYLFDCILCWFDRQPTLKFLVWWYLLSVAVTCKNWTLFLPCSYAPVVGEKWPSLGPHFTDSP